MDERYTRMTVPQLREAARRLYADEYDMGQQIDRLRARKDQMALEAGQLLELADERERLDADHG